MAEETQVNKTAQRLGKVSKVAIYLLVFILPIFFLPFTANVLDFNKQALLIVLVLISLFCWLLRALIEGKLSLNLSWLNLPVIIFLVVLGFATIFSLSSYASFWGWPLNISSSFLTTLGFVLFYFLVINLFQKEDVLGLLLTLVIASLLTIVFAGLQIFGQFLIPFDFTKAVSFNTIGTVNSLGIFVAGLLVLISSLILISRGLMRLFFFLVGLAGFVLLFLVNFWISWILLLVGAMVILTFGITRREIFQASWLVLPMIFLLVSLFFAGLKIPLSGLPATPLEVAPAQKTSLSIAFQVFKDRGPISLLFGSGPGTFVFDYSKFKPVEINQTFFWGVRFGSAASEILDKLATTGFLGLLSFLAILAVFLWLAFQWLIKKTKTAFPWVFGLGIFAAWLAVTVGLFLYSFNLSLAFIFWFLTACFVVLIGAKTKSFVLEPSSLAAIGASFIFILLLILGIGLLFLGGQRYIAEIRYQQALTAVQVGDNQKAVNYLLSAIFHTGQKQDHYLRDLAQVYLFRIQEELNRTKVTPEEIGQRITSLIANAVNSATTATNLEPNNVANWTVRGLVYQNLINLIGGAQDWAIKSYEEAAKLEPKNPFIFTQIGRVYLAQNNLEKAREQFEKSLALKTDYAPAHFQLAMVYIQENKIKEAINKLEETKLVAPFDIGLAFQLGLLYYNDNQFDKAQVELERAVSFDPNYSNARYFLGLIYDKKGKKDLAIEQFERIAQLNPDNEEVPKILANLKAGKAALEGIVPSQPPVEEKPPEKL